MKRRLHRSQRRSLSLIHRLPLSRHLHHRPIHRLPPNQSQRQTRR